MGQIYYLTYASRMSLKAGITPKTLVDIYTVSQTQNPSRQVTGFLCFGNGYFFQYIEGEKQTIDTLYASISKDKRHHNLTLMSEGFIEKRLFRDWQLLMVNINNPETPDEITAAFQPLITGISKREQAEKLVEVMRSQYNRRTLIDFENYSYKNVSYYGVSFRGLIKAHQHFLIVQTILFILILVSLSRL